MLRLGNGSSWLRYPTILQHRVQLKDLKLYMHVDGRPRTVPTVSRGKVSLMFAMHLTSTITLLPLAQQPSSLPNTMVADCLYGGRYLRVTPVFFCCQRDYSVVGKEIARNAVVQLSGLHTCSFCWKTGTRRALEVEAKTNGSSPSLPRGESTQRCGKPARLLTTSMAGTDPLMFNDHTMPPECLLNLHLIDCCHHMLRGAETPHVGVLEGVQTSAAHRI